MIRFIKKISSGSKENSIISYIIDSVLKDGAGFLLLQCVSIVIGFSTNYVLIKLTGMTVYGRYIYIFNILSLVSGICAAGTDMLLIQRNTVYKEAGEYSFLKGVFYFSSTVVIVISVIAGTVCFVVFTGANSIDNLKHYEWGWLFWGVLPLMSLLILIQSSLRGFKKIFLSQLPDKIIRPALILIVAALLLIEKTIVNLSEMVFISIMAVAISFLIAFILHARFLFSIVRKIKPRFEYGTWTRIAAGFLTADILFLLNSKIDIFLAGLLGNSETVSSFNVVLKISEVVGFSLFAVNFIIAPKVAELLYKKETSKLQEVITFTAKINFITAFPAGIILVYFRDKILSIFGIYSSEARIALIILCCSQFINAFLGSVGVILAMSGNQIFSILGLSVAIVTTILLNMLLTPVYNVIGVAIASSTGLILWNMIMYYFVRKKTGIRTTVVAGL